MRDFLLVSLRRRVVGSTWHRIQTDPDFSRGLQLSYWRDASRYQQVKRWVNIHRLRCWVAIDDNAEGWDLSDRARLVQTDAETGLSDPAVVARLSDLLGGVNDPRHRPYFVHKTVVWRSSPAATVATNSAARYCPGMSREQS